jgi:hypothetical protein
MTMDGRVPIKASEEGRMEFARSFYLRHVVDSMVEFVWVLGGHAPEREPGEMRRLDFGQNEDIIVHM